MSARGMPLAWGQCQQQEKGYTRTHSIDDNATMESQDVGPIKAVVTEMTPPNGRSGDVTANPGTTTAALSSVSPRWTPVSQPTSSEGRAVLCIPTRRGALAILHGLRHFILSFDVECYEVTPEGDGGSAQGRDRV